MIAENLQIKIDRDVNRSERPVPEVGMIAEWLGWSGVIKTVEELPTKITRIGQFEQYLITTDNDNGLRKEIEHWMIDKSKVRSEQYVGIKGDKV